MKKDGHCSDGKACATEDDRPHDEHDFLCIFGDRFVKYVHIVRGD